MKGSGWLPGRCLHKKTLDPHSQQSLPSRSNGDREFNNKAPRKSIQANAYSQEASNTGSTLSPGCSLNKFPTIHVISVVIATGIISTYANMRVDKDSTGLQILHIFHFGLFLPISMLLISFRPVKYSLYSLWSGVHSFLLLYSSSLILLIFSLFRYSRSYSNATPRYPVDSSKFQINFVGICAFCNAKTLILRGIGNDTCDVSLHYPRQRHMEYDKSIEASRSLSKSI